MWISNPQHLDYYFLTLIQNQQYTLLNGPTFNLIIEKKQKKEDSVGGERKEKKVDNKEWKCQINARR